MYQRVPPPVATEGKEKDAESKEDEKSSERAPKNVPTKLWERFKVLERKTDDITRRSTEKRMKYMQKSLLKKVQEEITLPEDRDILRQHDVKFGPPVCDDTEPHNRKRKWHASNNTIASTQDGQSSSGGASWENIKPYLTADDHLRRPDKDCYKLESGLESKITSAIKDGDFSRAEELSDHLSTREFGSKIAKAFDAHRYVERRKEEEEFKRSKKKKSLHWGFQEKQRWETKGNM
ncbi:protein FAM204A-like [Ylistrum balloti]|uniref:protein FAM204A-like n=1 Tax=Ylistrum balloti TaxID=509963 RepID=UPI002905E04B|nr:protein FAM204A-like [Ylistrum balloti]